jgi:hypothetical protein
MRRLAKVASLASALSFLVMIVPRWTAGWEEARRESVFERTLSQSVADTLSVCPPAGPELDAFLATSQSRLIGDQLWVPVCSVKQPSLGKIIVVTRTRTGLSECKKRDLWTPSSLDCALDEPLRYLADPNEGRTWARRQAGSRQSEEAIWMSSRPLAWQDHLVAEHRQWMTLFLGILTTLYLVAVRLRLAIHLQAACHGEGEPEPPRGSELFLHAVLGRRSRSLPGDLSEEYAVRLKAGNKREADRWYRWQVLNSAMPVVARRLECFILQGFRFGYRR